MLRGSVCVDGVRLFLGKYKMRCVGGVVPNVVSLSVVAPLFLYVGWWERPVSVAYTGLLVVAAVLLTSILADRRFTHLVMAYLCVGIPLLVYLGLQKDASAVALRRLLGVVGVVYALHHVHMLYTRPATFSPSALPRHPLRRGWCRC